MVKIAIVTYYKGNFGSILQCYATINYLALKGFSVDLLAQDETIEATHILKRLTNKIKKLVINVAHDPSCLIRLIKYRKEKMGLTTETRRKMDRFSCEVLKPHIYSEAELQRIGMRKEYDKIIVGSDQVWNFNNDFQKIYSLAFAPRESRVALSISLGEDHPNSKFQTQLNNVIRNFDKISVREKTAKSIIETLSNIPVEVMPDPTLLLDKNKWRELYKEKERKEENKPYILVHFLNHPSEIAIKSIEAAEERLKIRVKCIGYYYKVYSQKGWIFFDCDPIDYISFIDNASWVFTDSFHTTIFSINLEKDFFVFERMYMHGFPQTTRVIDLLRLFHLENQFIKKGSSICLNPIDKEGIAGLVMKEHKKICEYLDEAINC